MLRNKVSGTQKQKKFLLRQGMLKNNSFWHAKKQKFLDCVEVKLSTCTKVQGMKPYA